jgi:hypothetical protein
LGSFFLSVRPSGLFEATSKASILIQIQIKRAECPSFYLYASLAFSRLRAKVAF